MKENKCKVKKRIFQVTTYYNIFFIEATLHATCMQEIATWIQNIWIKIIFVVMQKFNKRFWIVSKSTIYEV